VLLVAVGGMTSAYAGEAAAANSCKGVERPCSVLTVPLDRTGAVPGTVRLHIERERARNPARPPLFMIAGGPGQSATRAFSNPDFEFGGSPIGTEGRSRDVIVIDLRGTGKSDVLRCRALERSSARSQAEAGAACAAELGARRAFYTADDSADDIEAVRVALRVPKIALYGTSYGTQVAMAYARRYPGNVDRLVLDSTVEPGGADPLYRSGMRAAPRVVGQLCAKRRCRLVTRDAAADLTDLAARLERRPMRGWVVRDDGRRRRASIDSFGLFTVLVAGDVNPLIQMIGPGAIHSALRGDAAPLLRAYRSALAGESHLSRPRLFSAAAYAAALCEESSFPWTPGAPGDQRHQQATAFVTAQPPGAFGPFGPSAPLGSDVLNLCRDWPAAGGSPAASGPLPNVPALLLAGGRDLRTPAENASAVAAQLPQAQLMVVRNSGHSVAGMDFTGCVDRGIRRFLAGGLAGRCAGERANALLPSPPRSFSELGRYTDLRGRPGKTVAAISWTMLDGFLSLAGDFWSGGFADGFKRGLRFGGLRGGRYTYLIRKNVFLLQNVSIVPGVRVSGRLRFLEDDDALMSGRLRVSGRAASEGTLRVRRDRLIGKLGGRRIRTGLYPSRFLPVVASAATASSSQRVQAARRLPRLR
jgi:pimeloyl-ACP methyl ester carboxylesterase